MRFLVDECTGPAVAKWLHDQGHEVFSVFDEARGADDESLIRKAQNEDWVLITNDKDFGAMVYRERRLHGGIILLRLDDERPVTKIETLSRLIDGYGERLVNSFVVATETQVRFAPI